MKYQRGFTLAELLVYAAIFAIVAGILSTIFFTIVNSQKKTAISGEVNQQLNFVLTTVQRHVGEASLVEAVYEGENPSSTCATFCTLRLRTTDPAKDPTIISSSASGVYLKEGQSPTSTLTTSKVLLNHFRLVKHEIPGGHAVVEISTSFAYNTSNPAYAVTKAIESAIARVSAATFDADLLPNQDNTFDIGQIAGSNLRWRNGHFSQNLTIAGSVGIGTTSPENALDVKGGIGLFSLISGGSWNFQVDSNGVLRFNANQHSPGGDTHMVIDDNSGNVGIGTTSPSSTLHLVGAFRYIDGNQGANRLLTSDASGNATWQAASGGAVHPYLRLEYTAGTLLRGNVIPLTVLESGNGATWSSNRFTAATAGVYFATVSGKAYGTSYMVLYIRKNGSTISSNYGAAPDPSRPGGASVSAVTYLNANDYIDFFYDHDSSAVPLTYANASVVYIGQ